MEDADEGRARLRYPSAPASPNSRCAGLPQGCSVAASTNEARPDQENPMITSVVLADPIAALMLTHLEVDTEGRVRTQRTPIRRGQRRHLRHARLRRLLA